ncbi:hypothetical protein HMPREF9555_01112 [Selenomonas artemidis F0399]|uniref:Uncharacterized protein n=1 Tax=Selenomonas artemidis F0399 TaxID=749551 RepID=E7N2A1_9FIRM|nr:hypothetical protein HMPREF9555_01112 [Selenomonas artemidis F0399]
MEKLLYKISCSSVHLTEYNIAHAGLKYNVSSVSTAKQMTSVAQIW